MFGAVLVTGARQVGKTTLLKEVSGNARYVTLDDYAQLVAARELSSTFLKDNPPPVFIDEVQYAPELFAGIKISLDESKLKGQFYLSGSQQFEMMKNISESLAGRVGILTLMGLSLRELFNVSFLEPFLPSSEYLSRRSQSLIDINYSDVWSIIHRGSFPELCANDSFDWQMFYAAYVKTYVERDVRALTQVADELKFVRFMTVAASRTGQLLNISSMARDVGISQPTAAQWLSILSTSNLVYLLQPYHNSTLKRTIRAPKLYFLDTGLAAYLTRWNTSEVLCNGAMAGEFFETFVVAEILKSYANVGILHPPLYFYRDKDGVEIDLLIEDSGTLYPIEIKKNADPNSSDVKNFAALDRIPKMKRAPGGLICLYDKLISLTETDKVIPIFYL
jgi:predicted AAA+ superfamily ATPase